MTDKEPSKEQRRMSEALFQAIIETTESRLIILSIEKNGFCVWPKMPLSLDVMKPCVRFWLKHHEGVLHPSQVQGRGCQDHRLDQLPSRSGSVKASH